MKTIPHYCIVLFTLLFVGCNVGSMEKAVDNGIHSIDRVKEFEKLFPNSDHFITHYTGTKGDSIWNSKVILHDRYVLSMQFDIDFDSSRLHPKRSGNAKFYLFEVESISKLPNGQTSISYTGNQIRFDTTQWTSLLKSSGDFSSIGYKMITNKPIAGIHDTNP